MRSRILEERLHDNSAYRTLCAIGRDAYSEDVDQKLASHIENLIRGDGEWTPIPNDHAFTVGEVVKVKHAFLPNNDGAEIRMKAGYCGIVNFIDG